MPPDTLKALWKPMTQHCDVVLTNSTTLCSRKKGTVEVLTPWPFSDGITVFCRWLISQLISTPPRMPLPQGMDVSSAASAFGTLIVTGLRVLKFSVMPNLGLMPLGWAYFQ